MPDGPPDAPSPSTAAPARGGHDDRFQRILAEHGPALRRAACAYEADAGRQEDLFQDICLAIWQALPRFRGDCSERTFAFRIAHNRGLSHRARKRPWSPLDSVRHHLFAATANPEAAAERAQRRRHLQAAIRQLPLGRRQVLTLSLEGLSHKEIGDILGLSANNVAVRLNRARGDLRRLLEATSSTTNSPKAAGTTP